VALAATNRRSGLASVPATDRSHKSAVTLGVKLAENRRVALAATNLRSGHASVQFGTFQSDTRLISGTESQSSESQLTRSSKPIASAPRPLRGLLWDIVGASGLYNRVATEPICRKQAAR
jgi:hypothetical protein